MEYSSPSSAHFLFTLLRELLVDLFAISFIPFAFEDVSSTVRERRTGCVFVRLVFVILFCMKQAIVDYHNHLIPKMVKFTIKNASEEEASFGLMIYRKKDAKETDPTTDQYIVFATNMKYSDAKKIYRKIPLEYKKRWGIETGFRVQNTIKAMTTSQNYTIRIIYRMLSVIIYNLWQLANILLAAELMVKLKDPLIKLTHLARIFRLEIETPPWQPQ